MRRSDMRGSTVQYLMVNSDDVSAVTVLTEPVRQVGHCSTIV